MCSDRSDWLKPAGFPHSEIQGSRVVCTSPWLIAAYHVLHRLHAPRHPPCALSSLTIKFAHRKLDQHIVSLTPSSSRMPESSLEDSKTFRRNLSFLGILPIRLSKSTNDEMIVKLVTTDRRLLVEVRGLEPLTPWLQTMCSAS